MNKLNVLVSYDISDDRRRNRLAKILKDYGIRVQYSVFELQVNDSQLAKLLGQVASVINTGDDNVRYYTLCAGCVKKVIVQGQNNEAFVEEEYIII